MDSQAASGKRGQLLCVVIIFFRTLHKYVHINGQGIAAFYSVSNYGARFNHSGILYYHFDSFGHLTSKPLACWLVG